MQSTGQQTEEGSSMRQLFIDAEMPKIGFQTNQPDGSMFLILFPLLYFLAGVDKVVRMILAPPGTLTTVHMRCFMGVLPDSL